MSYRHRLILKLYTYRVGRNIFVYPFQGRTCGVIKVDNIKNNLYEQDCRQGTTRQYRRNRTFASK